MSHPDPAYLPLSTKQVVFLLVLIVVAIVVKLVLIGG